MAELDLVRGSCLCEQIKYEIRGKSIIAAHCHCRECQKSTGTGHATGVMFREDSITIDGKPTAFTGIAESGNTVTRLFCSHCGSSLFSRNSGMLGFMTVSAGTLDEPNIIEPQVIVFARNRNHWDTMDRSLPTFDDQPEWKPEDET